MTSYVICCNTCVVASDFTCITTGILENWSMFSAGLEPGSVRSDIECCTTDWNVYAVRLTAPKVTVVM
jgi:hypothetical protein